MRYLDHKSRRHEPRKQRWHDWQCFAFLGLLSLVISGLSLAAMRWPL